jgi:hypothetical protein
VSKQSNILLFTFIYVSIGILQPGTFHLILHVHGPAAVLLRQSLLILDMPARSRSHFFSKPKKVQVEWGTCPPLPTHACGEGGGEGAEGREGGRNPRHYTRSSLSLSFSLALFPGFLCTCDPLGVNAPCTQKPSLFGQKEGPTFLHLNDDCETASVQFARPESHPDASFSRP